MGALVAALLIIIAMIGQDVVGGHNLIRIQTMCMQRHGPAIMTGMATYT